MRLQATVLLAALTGVGLTSIEVAGQGADQVKKVPSFDPDRAMLAERPNFDAFRVSETRSLADALKDGAVERQTPLMVMQRDEATLALITTQMAYHHVAQGNLMGEPWLVTF